MSRGLQWERFSFVPTQRPGWSEIQRICRLGCNTWADKTNETICVIWPRESVSDPQDAEARQQGPGQADAGGLRLGETRRLGSGLAAAPPGMGQSQSARAGSE